MRYAFEKDLEEETRIRAGKRIRQLREDNGLKVKALSDQLQIDRKTLEAYENAESLLPVRTALKLCNIFDCELDYLLGFQDHKIKETGSFSEYTGLDDSTVEALHKRQTKRVELERFIRKRAEEVKRRQSEGEDIDILVGRNMITIEQYHEYLETKEYPFLQYLIREAHTLEAVANAIQAEQKNGYKIRRIKKNKDVYRILDNAFNEVRRIWDKDLLLIDATTNSRDLVNELQALFCFAIAEKIGIEEPVIKKGEQKENESQDIAGTVIIEKTKKWIEDSLNHELSAEEVFNVFYEEATKKRREYAISEAFMNIVRVYLEEGAK